MNDILFLYYETLGNKCPANFREIIELCHLNAALFNEAIIQEKELRQTQETFFVERSNMLTERANMDMLLSGIGVFFYKRNDMCTSGKIFELALKSGNIVAMAYLQQCILDGTTLPKFIDMQKKCEDTVFELLNGETCTKKIDKIFFEKIFECKLKVDELIKREADSYTLFREHTLRINKTIKHAIALATYTIDFDIESFYNLEEVNKLLL